MVRNIRPIPPSPIQPRVFVGPIAAGAKIVASTRSETYTFIRSNYSDALAVEMEGHGFLDAVHVNPGVEALVVRDISDLIDGKSEADAGGLQEIASRNASAFAFEVLANFELPNEDSEKEYEAGLESLVTPKDSVDFKKDLRVEALIRNMGVGDWAAARDAAIEILNVTDESGQNELFDALLRYQEYPNNEDMHWGALITIESFAELAPWLIDRKLLVRMAKHKDFSIRSSAASICMTLAEFAPDRVPVDLLVKLSMHDEDWYVMAPATAALKSMARHRPAILHVFFNRLRSSDRHIRERGYPLPSTNNVIIYACHIQSPDGIIRKPGGNLLSVFLTKTLVRVILSTYVGARVFIARLVFRKRSPIVGLAADCCAIPVGVR